MTRDELLDLCERYVRQRGLMNSEDSTPAPPPVIEIIDGYLHAELSENEKNSLLAYVRGASQDVEDDDTGHDLDGVNALTDRIREAIAPHM